MRLPPAHSARPLARAAGSNSGASRHCLPGEGRSSEGPSYEGPSSPSFEGPSNPWCAKAGLAIVRKGMPKATKNSKGTSRELIFFISRNVTGKADRRYNKLTRGKYGGVNRNAAALSRASLLTDMPSQAALGAAAPLLRRGTEIARRPAIPVRMRLKNSLQSVLPQPLDPIRNNVLLVMPNELTALGHILY